MQFKQILASIAVVGTVATVALLNLTNDAPAHQTLLHAHDEVETAFQNYLAKYHKSYATHEEYLFRLNVFSANYHDIMNHNMLLAGTEGFTKAINKFSDLTSEEFSMMLGYKPELFPTNATYEILPESNA